MTVIIALGVLSLASALAYGAYYVHQPVSVPRTVVKGLAVGALAVISALSAAPVALTVALAFGTLGDLFLSRDGERNFLLGLGAFLIGHVAYVVLLSQFDLGLTLFDGTLWPLLPVIALLVIGGVIVRRLLPHLGSMRLPVLAYAAVILTMGVFALNLPLVLPVVFTTVGAMMFIASDAILGFELFVFKDRPRPSAATLLWALYWGGQAIILASITLLMGLIYAHVGAV